MFNNRLFFNSLKIIVLVLCIASLISFIVPGIVPGPKTFSGFLEYLSSVPTETIYDYLKDTITEITTDWGFFNFFRDFINELLTIIRGINLISKYVTLGVRSFLYFLKYFFF